MEPCPELIELTKRVYVSFLADPTSARLLLLDDPGTLAVGTDGREWWQGYAKAAAIFELQSTEMRGYVRSWTSHDAEAYRHGDVGWCVDQSIVEMNDGESVAMRISIVYVLDRAQWRIAHWHASVGLPNEDVLGIDLSTTLEALAEAAEAERPSVTASAAADGTVTLLFSDIEGSTATLETLGDRRYRDLLAWHHAIVREQVRAHSGQEVSCEGDGFMLAFSSARRAVRCALDVQDALANSDSDQPPVRVRIGIHTGEVLRSEDEFYGRTVHYAARVASAAAGTEVLVSDLVRSLLEGTDEIVVRETRELELKGFAGTHSVHLVDRG